MFTSLDETTPGNPLNALYLAQACSLAYYDEAMAVPGFR